MSEQFKLKLCTNGFYYLHGDYGLVVPYICFDRFNKESAEELIDLVNRLYDECESLEKQRNELSEENEQLKQRNKYNLEDCNMEIAELRKENKKLEKENKELKSIKKFADDNGINIFKIDEAFYRCWDDNGRLVEENQQLRKELEMRTESDNYHQRMLKKWLCKDE